MISNRTEKRLAIIGGGLAGMAAAAAAVERGCRVALFEKSNTLGGRVNSFVDQTTGETVDFCQHAAMGCCTEFLDFCRQTGIEDCFERHETMHFIAPDGRQCDIAPSRWLPPPLHLLPGFLRLDFLSRRERWSLAWTMRKLIALKATEENSRETIGAWLHRHGQPNRAIEQFWSVVLVSALGETVDRASLIAAQKVFRDGFWASRQASELWLPRRPLSDIFHARMARWLGEHGVDLRLGASVERIEGDGRLARALVLADGARREFDAAIVAVPWRRVRGLFDENLTDAMPALAEVDRIEPAAITAVHLWFDRPITRLPHAVPVGRLSQWVFSRSKPSCGCAAPIAKLSGLPIADGMTSAHYYQVVISASRRLARRSREEWLSEICGELAVMWPEARRANLIHGRVITQPAAVFSVTPECERLRQHFSQRTPVENLFLAGDWTATGWPATMEGAVRSGRLAVEAMFGSM